MIVAPCTQTGPSPLLRVITQNDHAHLAARILALWHSNGLPSHPRRTLLLSATREHDNGWREADSAPSCREDGHLMDFLSVSTPQRLDIWQRGAVRFAERDPQIALLIVQHALQLHSRHFSSPSWQDALGSWRGLRSELLERINYSEEQLAADYRWIELADVISLALCSDWYQTFALGPWRIRALGNNLEIDPFPLVGTTTFTVPCRIIPKHPFPNAIELATELAIARWQEHELRISPPTRPLEADHI